MGTSLNPDLPLNGRNIGLTIFVGQKPLPVTDVAMSISVDWLTTQYRDKYLGRDLDRTDEHTVGYDLKVELDYTGNNSGNALIDALMAQKALRAANAPFDDISVGFEMHGRDGTLHGWSAQKVTTKPSFNFRGKDERGKVTLDLQAEDFKKIVL